MAAAAHVETVSPASQSAKRKTSPARSANDKRPAKRRASRACHSCRARKVRCDVVTSGSPCTNCRLDSTECIVPVSKRNMGKRVYDDENNLPQTSPSSDDNLDDLPLCLTFDNTVKVEHPQSLSHIHQPRNNSLELEKSHHVPHAPRYLNGRRLTNDAQRHQVSPLPKDMGPSLPLSQHALRNFKNGPETVSEGERSLPRFLRPLPRNMPAVDVEYLQRKGALMIPHTGLRNELLRSYVQYVHPFMPILDLNEIFEKIERNDETDPISLLLFQAVMFAGIAFVDARFLQGLPYRNRKMARKVFFDRVRQLYDFNVESDRVALLQALLLMTYWYETPDDHKHTWHWMGVSLSLAHTMGMHRNPEHSRMDHKMKRMRRRIWWSCFIRDRLIALGIRRSYRIRTEEFDVPMLVQEDFDTEPLGEAAARLLGPIPITHDAGEGTVLAIICIEMAKLCVCLSHVLSSQYSVLSQEPGWELETTMMLVRKRSAKQVCEILRCDEELEEWVQGLAPDSQYITSDERSNNADNVTNIHRAVLHMVYLTTLSALQRPQIFRRTTNVDAAAETQAIARCKVRGAAIELTKVAYDMYLQDQVRLLPTSGVAVLLSAVISHLLDIRSKDDSIRTASVSSFYQCMQVLHRLREIYASADSAVLFIAGVVRNAHIQIPALKPEAKVVMVTQPEQLQPKNIPHASSEHQPLHDGPSLELLQIARNLLLNNNSTTLEERNLLLASSSLGANGAFDRSLYGPTVATENEWSNSMQGLEYQHSVEGVNSNFTSSIRASSEAEMDLFDALINFDADAELLAAQGGFGCELDVDWMAQLLDRDMASHGFGGAAYGEDSGENTVIVRRGNSETH